LTAGFNAGKVQRVSKAALGKGAYEASGTGYPDVQVGRHFTGDHQVLGQIHQFQRDIKVGLGALLSAHGQPKSHRQKKGEEF
jgi:hypothetical protein